ncbi:hypothetical protein HK102_005964 [Quaeritorhiza haematococci]|nr:hypothetical protein HK102_005964 [Quaeritorhiza haematococci]
MMTNDKTTDSNTSGGIISNRMSSLLRSSSGLSDILTFVNTVYIPSLTSWLKKGEKPSILAFGNPQDFPLPSLVSTLHKNIEPTSATHFEYLAYGDPRAREVVCTVLDKRINVTVNSDDVFITNGALVALNIVAEAILDPEDEVIVITPLYFWYEGLVRRCGATPVPVPSNPDTGFDLDVPAIVAAITPRTRAIIINSPNNPTGRIYEPETLKHLAEELMKINDQRQKGSEGDRPIVIISDEAYRRIILDEDVTFTSIAQYYPYTAIVYTYGKQTLAPGVRVGYIALPASMPDHHRTELSRAIRELQICGWNYANNDLQYGIKDLEGDLFGEEGVCIDLAVLRRRRDRLVEGLREKGYTEVSNSQATFYMMVKVPAAFEKYLSSEASHQKSGESPSVDYLFSELMAKDYGVFFVPGLVMKFPGWFRLSVTASDEMVELAIERFGKALDDVAHGRSKGKL